MSKLFADAVDYQKYRATKNLPGTKMSQENELKNIIKKIAVHKEDWMFSGKDPVSIFASLQEFNASFDACNIHEGPVMRSFKHYLIGNVVAVKRSKGPLPTKTTKSKAACLTSFLQLSTIYPSE